MKHLTNYKVFENTTLSKDQLIQRLKVLVNEFDAWMDENDKITKSNHNKGFGYCNIDGIHAIKSLTNKLSNNSFDGEVRAVCNEIVYCKIYHENAWRMNTDYFKDNSTKPYEQEHFVLKYWTLGDTVDKMIKGTKWDMEPITEITQEDLDFIKDSIEVDMEDFSLVSVMKSIGNGWKGVPKTCCIKILKSDSGNGYGHVKSIDVPRDFMGRLNSYFGSAIEIDRGSPICYIYLPFKCLG
jgi:hypothetical protein